MTDLEQVNFYVEFVRHLRDRGILCAITSDLACVHYAVAETTKDCDLLCHPESFHLLLEELSRRQIGDSPCRYRGKLSPPLHERWHQGGWTSHFEWGTGPDAVTLDVFGVALRGSVPWQHEISGLYASPQIVSEMKRTNRDKDWAFITALGTRMVLVGDSRGWLHLYQASAIDELLEHCQCPPEIVALRPALGLAIDRDPRVAGALNAERSLWEKLDELRIRIYEHALRPYVAAVRKAQIPATASLMEQHQVRVEIAELHLPAAPLQAYGIDRHLADARRWLIESRVVPVEAIDWLPDVRKNFNYLTDDR